MRKTITYGKTNYSYDVIPANRKTLEIAVHPDQTIVVKAPISSSSAQIAQKVYKRIRWIKKQLAYFEQFQPRTPERKYIGGESHLYLGRHYRLKIKKGSQNRLVLWRGYFQATTVGNAIDIKAMMDKWYMAIAKIKFQESFDRCWESMKKSIDCKPDMKIRHMKTRWGSISKTGTMTLNINLIKAPRNCIDYVVIHELCHLVHANHSNDFYALLEKVLPDWKDNKKLLELTLA
jgi:predicted metal-dependent hydrolase